MPHATQIVREHRDLKSGPCSFRSTLLGDTFDHIPLSVNFYEQALLKCNLIMYKLLTRILIYYACIIKHTKIEIFEVRVNDKHFLKMSY